MKRTIFTVLSIILAVFVLLGMVGVVEAKEDKPSKPEVKVTICHATSSKTNPYTENTVSGNSLANKDSWMNGHGKHSEDIWPTFTLKDGYVVDAQGDQNILNNGCEIPPVLVCRFTGGIWDLVWTDNVLDSDKPANAEECKNIPPPPPPPPHKKSSSADNPCITCKPHQAEGPVPGYTGFIMFYNAGLVDDDVNNPAGFKAYMVTTQNLDGFTAMDGGYYVLDTTSTDAKTYQNIAPQDWYSFSVCSCEMGPWFSSDGVLSKRPCLISDDVTSYLMRGGMSYADARDWVMDWYSIGVKTLP